MGKRDIPVVGTVQPETISGQREACHCNCHQQCQGHDIEAESLYGNHREIVKAPVESQDKPDKQ